MKNDFVQPYKILQDIVNFDTTSAASNAPLIDYVCDYLASFKDVSLAIVDNGCDPSNPDTGILKANLIVRIGPDEPGGIMLSAHTDCVPVNVSEWKTPPFTLTPQNGLLYGRGTTDMKSFIACALAEVPAWAASNLRKPIYLVLSHDEEIGCLGVIEALRIINKHNIKPYICIVGEPTEMAVAFAHKTRADIDLVFSATGGHVSKIDDPAITCANLLAARLIGHMNIHWKDIAKEINGNGFLGDPTFAPTAWKTPATHNVIAAQTTVHLDYRGTPGVAKEKLVDFFQKQATLMLETLKQEKTGFANVDVHVRIGNQGFLCEDQSVLSLAKQLADTDKLVTVDYVCEAARFFEAGIKSAVICGPGSIMQAHKPNEYIAVSEVEACSRMMRRIGAYSCKHHSFS